VPVPRRFDRRPPDRDTTRINDRIRVPEVRLVGEDGKQIGVVKTSEALAYAQERDLDLVEVAPDARPPVCRVLDYSKYKYEQAQKQKAARKHQQQITIREIKFRPKIAQNDYDTKKGHVERFLRGHDKVKVTIMFRGREVTHPERGTALLDRLAGELAEIAVIEQAPLQDGRNMTMLLAPSKAVLNEERGAKPSADGAKGTNGAGPAAAGKAKAPRADPDASPGDADSAAGADAAGADGAPADAAGADGAPADAAGADAADADAADAGAVGADAAGADAADADAVGADGAPEADAETTAAGDAAG
jgi:translation initiation factor IF-3